MGDRLINATDNVTDTRYYHADTGTLDRIIFTDDAIYQAELERIFKRAWNFVCHDSQIPNTGDFFTNWIGEDEVIAVRGRDGRVNVLLNTCAHRGNTVCRAELGNTRSFFCSYHGWNFDLDGKLIGMPGEQDFYRDDLDKSQWGLPAAAKVSTYRGFVFATLDGDAPPLEDYLGWVGRLGIDFMASQGDLQFLDGVQKNRLQCNWKIAVDNLYDWYHVKVSHGSALKLAIVGDESMSPMQQMVVLGEYGHGIGGPGLTEAEYAESVHRLRTGEGEKRWYDRVVAKRMDAAVSEQLGPVGKRTFGHPNIFPNLWVTTTRQLCLRIPRGPNATELWWFTYTPKEASAEERRFYQYTANHIFGPAGLLEQDDGENWSHSTRGAKGLVAKTRPVNLSMGMGRDTVSVDPSGQAGIETVVNEHGQRWNYQSWQEWMQADSWQTLIANHSQPPNSVV